MLDSDLFRDLVAEASLAPSVHNIQPTRWRLFAADTVRGRYCPLSVLADWPVSSAALVERHPLPAGRRLVNIFRFGRSMPGAAAARARLPLAELIV